MIPYGKIDKPEDVGRIVRAVRSEAGVTQADAAALVGTGVRFLSELERGKPTVELGRVLKVLARLGVDVHLVPRGQPHG